MSDKDPYDPNAPKSSDHEGVDIDFEDDLEGWGEDNEDDGEFSDATEISVSPDDPAGFVDNQTVHDDSHNKPTRRYQTSDMPQVPDESPDNFQNVLDDMGGQPTPGPLQGEMTVEKDMAALAQETALPEASVDPLGQTTPEAPPLPDDSELQPAYPDPATQEVPPSDAALFGDDDGPLIAEDTLSRKLDAVFPDGDDDEFPALTGDPDATPLPGTEMPATEMPVMETAPDPALEAAPTGETEIPDLAPPGDEPTQDQPLPEEDEPAPEPVPAPDGTDPLIPYSTSDWDPDLLGEDEATPAGAPLPHPGADQGGEDRRAELAGDWSPVEVPVVVEEEADPEALQQAQQPEEPFSIEPLRLETPLPEGEGTWLSDYSAFKNETQSLARQGQWQTLAAVTGHALMHAPYSDSHTRPGMLLDLARIYRDRLGDDARAEEAFALLARMEPANGEALSFLVEHYQQRGEWGAIYDLYVCAVEATWDPHERLSWTHMAAALADEKLNDVSLAILAWEHLWRLGDAVEDAARELSRLYRATGRWSEMAAFLGQEAERLQGPAQLVVLRELAEVTLSGLRDPDGASAVLEQIVERSPQDPIATLQLARVYTQRKDWDGLERLTSAEAQQQLSAEAAQDLQHMVADAFWNAERLEQAVEVYDRILEQDPTDSLGIQRKQEYLTRTERYEALLDLLLAKAEAAEGEERAELLARCAALSEEQLDNLDQAAKLWEQRIAIDEEHLPSYEALARLYEVQNDLEGVARATEGQLDLIKDLNQRVDLYRKLGEHYAQRMGDDDKAEACWKAILQLAPNDFPAREELIKLHRRRGDFESLNSALARQIWITDDEERALKLARMAAENLDQNFDDAERSVEGWRRVLDFAPRDVEGLQALGRHYETLERRRDLIAVLEQEMLALDDDDDRIERALKVASLWEEEEVPRAAAAVYERILRWAPTNRDALDRLVETYKEQGKVGMAVGLLEHACTLETDHNHRVALLLRVLDLLDEEDHVGRFNLLRRVFLLSGGAEAGEELKAEAGAADRWPEMVSVLAMLASKESDTDRRVALLRETASILEEKLEQPDRAYLALQRIFVSANPRDEVLDEVSRLAYETGRYEDLLALLDRFTSPEFDLDRRRRAMHQRAEICEKDLEDGLRAFQEHRRLLELAEDREPLAELERLAETHDLWGRLCAVLTELGDQAGSDEDRLELLARRERIWREKLENPEEAFFLLAQRYRVAPRDEEVQTALAEDAEAQERWDLVLPLQEASVRSAGISASSEELIATAGLLESKLDDADRAMELTAAAFIAAPDAEDMGPKLEELAEKDGRHEALADVFRQAAAMSEDSERTVVLLRRIATIYEDKLDQPGKAIGIYSRLLDLQGDDVESLEVMIGWHRVHEEWRDLRDRLHQRVEMLEEDEEKVPLMLEIAKLSQEQLGDSEEALGVFGEIVEIDPEHEEALGALEELVGTISEPGPRLRWLTMQLKQSTEERTAELRLEIAQIQEHDLQDRGAAIETLQELAQASGPEGRGFDELRRLLEEAERWKDLVLLLRDKASATEDEQEMKAALEEAMFFCNEYLGEAAGEIWEDLYRSMLTINPSDKRIRTHLARYYRQAGRFEELAAMLQENLGHIKSDRDRVASRFELARLQALNLDQLEDASTSWMEILEDDPKQEAALLALARVAYGLGDVETYVAYRRQQAQLLPPHEAALVLCHLAEVADENEEINDQMVPLYREARTIDPDNVPAMEALKGIGRRLKNLRPAAALLPLDGERDLELSQRAERLMSLGDGSMDADLNQAIEWYWRSVAVDPDNPKAWLALAAALDEVPDKEKAYRARTAWQQTFSRLQPMDAEQLTGEAQRQFELALAARSSKLEAEYEHHVGRAYDTVPSFAPAALAMAQSMIEGEQIEEAHALLHSILLHNAGDLSEPQLVAAHYARGLTLRQLGRPEEAMADMREVLQHQPLHADALASMGEMLSASGRCAAAIEIHIRALTAVEDARERAETFYRLGVLWEDGMEALGEAGVCYELALAEGLEHRDLLRRALAHFQRVGALERSLTMVGSLLPTATDPDELAALWLARGQNYASGEGREKEAVEAFDMALSYDPACHEARDGLTLVLERLEDWPQLLQVLEATCDVGTAEQQSAALLRMANISSHKLQDPDNAEQFLKRSVEIFPTLEALEQLEQIYTFESGRLEERKDIVGLLTGFGPPWFERCLELSKLLLADDKVRAWCLLSPLLGVSQVDPDIKAVIQAMRKEFERPAILCPSEEDYPLLRHPDAAAELTAVLAEVGGAVKDLGMTSLDAAGDGNAIPIGENTTMGKAFGAVAEAMGLSGCVLHRTQSLEESVCVVNVDPDPVVVVRTDVMQQLVHAEVGFLFAYVLELAKPGNRVMAAMAAGERDTLLPALWSAIGFGGAGGELADLIVEATDAEQRAAWAEQLAAFRDEDPVELGQRWWSGTCLTARRAGLLAGADLRQVFRVQSRLEEEVSRPRVVARMSELDEYVGSSEILMDLVAFSASPAFGALMASAVSTSK